MTERDALVIKGLRVAVEGKEILRGVDLVVRKGEIHALMGPNGSGKSTLAYTLMGHPAYQVLGGEVWYKGQNILGLKPDERAKLGLFLAFQYPTPIPGVSVANFLRTALNALRRNGEEQQKSLPVSEFRKKLNERMALLKVEKEFASRYLNDGFSGGEKKKSEILQMALLEPEMVIMDETDSGLDIDALKTVSEAVNRLAGPNMGVLVITHYQRLLNHITPHFVHILINGKVMLSGGPELAHELEAKGYAEFEKRVAQEVSA
ncbi:MAG: Fe-S cluster assembly ATPase SufC [Chloroflexi bacterium]|nr:Fe-S cluster assembly ATPase SufC [Chloroflexota bacterium]